MTFDWSVLLTAFLLGLFSSAHCIGMCGGVMGALSMAVPATEPRRRLFILTSYNIGRVLSYGVMGVLVGIFAQQLMAAGGAFVLRWLAGLLLITMGLYLASWWRGLTYLETAGRYFWAYLQPLGKRLMPVNSPGKGLLLGALWGWLPCGLVYSALAYSMAQGHWVSSGLAMLAFGLGTLPSLLAAGIAAQQLTRLLQLRQLRWVMAILLILFGVWTLWGASGHAHGDSHGAGHSAGHGAGHEELHSADHEHHPAAPATDSVASPASEDTAHEPHHEHHEHNH
jgi:sulfite exporter TauE/SafE